MIRTKKRQYLHVQLPDYSLPSSSSYCKTWLIFVQVSTTFIGKSYGHGKKEAASSRQATLGWASWCSLCLDIQEKVLAKIVLCLSSSVSIIFFRLWINWPQIYPHPHLLLDSVFRLLCILKRCMRTHCVSGREGITFRKA